MGDKISEVSYFFPAHNEEANIRQVIESALEYLPTVTDAFEIIAVNDGSKDKTREIGEELARVDPRVVVVNHEVNKGYGEALKSGIRASRYEWIFFTDGDLQFDIKEFDTLLNKLHETAADAVIGYRIARQDPWHRTLNAKLYRMLIRTLFGLKVRDIDCAFKLLKAEKVKNLTLKSGGALLSAEMLIRMFKSGCKIEEVGVHHYPRLYGEQSGAKLSVILRMFRELFKLAGELRREEKNKS